MQVRSRLLPTGTFDSWTITSLRDSLVNELASDEKWNALSLFFYAITETGWAEVKKPVVKWMRADPKRIVTLFAGTDHGITDPAGLLKMKKAGVDVRLMDTYRGVFHPKLVWLQSKSKNLIWVCSNNLTRDGMLNNIEFAALIRTRTVPSELIRWSKKVAQGSVVVDEALLSSYRDERNAFERQQARSKTTTFTWSRKKEPKTVAMSGTRQGDLIVEIMPEETRGGNQIQIPKEAAREFFGLTKVGEQRTIRLQPLGMADARTLIITVFGNNTIRLSINELEYGDRPCVILFHKQGKSRFLFEIVPQNIFPTRYRDLIAMCVRQTRTGSRRWVISK